MNPEILTTGQAGKLAGVGPHAVVKWINSGKLKAFTIPGSKHRRILKTEFDKFATENNLPCAPPPKPIPQPINHEPVGLQKLLRT